MKIAVSIFLFITLCSAQEYAIRSFTTHDGLISNFVTTLKQDSKGYLWVGTDEGFSIFDGSTFRNNRPKRKELWGYINAFFESSVHPGTMWIATNGGGILRYENGNYVQQLVDTLSEANRVNDLFEDANGVLWFTTDHGFYRMKEGLISPIPLSLRHSPFLIQVSAAGSDQLFISSPEGVMIYHTVTGAVRIILTADITGTNGQIFPIDRNGAFAVLTRSSLKLLRDDRVLQTLDLDRGEYGNGTLDASGDLWIGGTECVRRVRFEKGRAQIHSTFDMNNGLPVNDVSGLESDRENNVWFGTMGKGIARLQDPENMRFRFDKLTSRGTSDHRNRIWVPTVDALQALTRNSDRSWHASTIKCSADRRPVALQFVGRDRLWCTTAMGTLTEYRVHSLPNNEIDLTLSTTLDARSSLPKLYPIVLFKDSKDFLWCAKDDGGVIIVDSRSPASVTQKHLSFPGVPRMTMSAFAEGPGGIVVAGGSGTNALLEFKFIEGSYQYQKAYRYDSLISQYGIRSLTFAPDSSLWIGTRYDGIIRKYRDGTVTHYTLQDGLHSLQILSLLSDGKAMWVGMQSGLEYIPDINAPRFILSTELTTSPIYTLGRYTDSTVWAMSRYEVTVNDPNVLITQTPAPPIYLTQFDVNGVAQPLEPGQEFIRNDLISCSFTYAAVTLKGNMDVKYQYRLEGLHHEWQNLTPERSVTFANLGAGDYRFVVRAVLNNGRHVTESVQQSFVIVPALWDRWWFAPLILSIILSVAAGVSILRVRQRFVLEKIRVSIAADLHDDIGSVLARIANLADIMVVYSSKKRTPASKKTGTTKKRIVKRSLPEANAQTIADLSRELMEKMSDVVWSVNPDNDDPKKLTERLQTYCTEIAENHRLQVNFTADGVFERRSIDPQKTRAALLIVKESLTNILKHSRATKIDLSVQIMPKRWSITIADDGVGFNEDELPRVNGIYNMRSRAAACGGDVQVTSSSGNGTMIRLEIPL